MTLRTQMLTLSLATLLVPWFGWMLVKELEEFLRANQERALLNSAETLAASLPDSGRVKLLGRDGVLPLREFPSRPVIDGYGDEWPEPRSATVFEGVAGEPRLALLAGNWRGQIHLLLRVTDRTARREQPPTEERLAGPTDAVLLHLRSGRGLTRFRIQTAAPGPLLVESQTTGGGQLVGHWNDHEDGYRVELALPASARAVDLSIGVEDAYRDRAGVVRVSEAGTLRDGQPASWLVPAPRDPALAGWLERVTPPGARAWIIDRRGWVVADSPPRRRAVRSPSWVERFIYWLVAGDQVVQSQPRGERPLRLDDPLVAAALNGETGSVWSGEPESAEIRNTVAVALDAGGAPLGALVLEADTDGALLFTNRTLGRLLGISLLLTLVLVLGLWFLATRLSRRVRSLSGAVSEAMEDASHPRDLPMTGDRDELGELARNNARLLRAVADYTRYLRTLAGRLSHELKTPLAITRTSLDNLASSPMDADGRRYLDRAREGLARQTAIVQAMSEASRLEAAVEAADWETVDLAAVVRACAEGYRGVHPDRMIALELPEGPVPCRCAPDLLAQALDKLVDNAVSLTAPNERITLVLQPKGNWRHLSVRNTGTRLPEQLRDQLFDSLVSVRDAGAGLHLGLGLHIVRLVAEAHGGSVEARNLPDEGGVTFTLHLPAG
jgi:two-component system sensor histidine kinase ChvG